MKTRFYCEECEGRGEHEIWCALNPQPVPTAQEKAEEAARIEARVAASKVRADQFQAAFQALIAGRVKIARANYLDTETRTKFGLYQERKNEITVLSAEGNEGLWYHGWTVIARQNSGRITASYGGNYDIYVLPSDPAAEVAREN